MIGIVDIGGTKTSVGVMEGRSSSPLVRRVAEAPTLPERGFEDFMRRVTELLPKEVEGLAVGATGPVDRLRGVFGRVDTLPGFEGSNLKAALSTSFGIDPERIVIENDADAAALGEAVHGAGRSASRVLYVTISTGIGGGLVIDGEIYRGADGVHPEIGHHMLEPSSGPRCSCGARGCWEALASGSAMVSRGMSAERVCEAARNGERWAKGIVEREGFYLGVGVANSVAMFAPDVIVLGGGVMRSADLFLDRIHNAVKESCTLVSAAMTKIMLATLGPDAGLFGAAEAFRRRFG